MILEGCLFRVTKLLYLGIIIMVELISMKFRMLMYTHIGKPIPPKNYEVA